MENKNKTEEENKEINNIQNIDGEIVIVETDKKPNVINSIKNKTENSENRDLQNIIIETENKIPNEENCEHNKDEPKINEDNSRNPKNEVPITIEIKEENKNTAPNPLETNVYVNSEVQPIKDKPEIPHSIDEKNKCIKILEKIGTVTLLAFILIFFNIAKLICTCLFNSLSGCIFLFGGVFWMIIGFLCQLPRCICAICSKKADDRVDHQIKGEESASPYCIRGGAYFRSGIKFICLIIPDILEVIRRNFIPEKLFEFTEAISVNARKYWETNPCDVVTSTTEAEKYERRVEVYKGEIKNLEKEIEKSKA